MRLPLVLDGLDARRDPNAAGGRWQHAPPCPAKGIRPPSPATEGLIGSHLSAAWLTPSAQARVSQVCRMQHFSVWLMVVRIC